MHRFRFVHEPLIVGLRNGLESSGRGIDLMGGSIRSLDSNTMGSSVLEGGTLKAVNAGTYFDHMNDLVE